MSDPTVPTSDQTRTCRKCGAVLAFSQFKLIKSCRFGIGYTCRKCDAKKCKAWADRNRDQVRAKERLRVHDPRRKARQKVIDAVRNGRMTKPDKCNRCGGTFPRHLIHGHHVDYTKPLEVEWLCGLCHGVERRRGLLRRIPIGRKTKLNAAQVKEIRDRIRDCETLASIARSYGVDRTTILAIKRGQTWKECAA